MYTQKKHFLLSGRKVFSRNEKNFFKLLLFNFCFFCHVIREKAKQIPCSGVNDENFLREKKTKISTNFTTRGKLFHFLLILYLLNSTGSINWRNLNIFHYQQRTQRGKLQFLFFFWKAVAFNLKIMKPF